MAERPRAAAAAPAAPATEARAQVAPGTPATGAVPDAADALRGSVTLRYATLIPSTDPSVQWRLSDEAGIVERSADGGRTWLRLGTGITSRFTAGSSPSATMCWVVGAGGIVAITSDARTWLQVSSPAPDADLIRVVATDDRTATVRDRQGRQFSTTDGGATWSPIP